MPGRRTTKHVVIAVLSGALLAVTFLGIWTATTASDSSEELFEPGLLAGIADGIEECVVAIDPAPESPRFSCEVEINANYSGLAFSQGDLLDAEGVTVVDPGGPAITPANIRGHVLAVSQELPTHLVVGLVPKYRPEVTTACASADTTSAPELCELDQLFDLHTTEYGQAIRALLAALEPDRQIGLVGASYAGMRWSYMISSEIAPKLDVAVVVSPVFPGADINFMESTTFDAAEVVLSRYVAENGCFEGIDCEDRSISGCSLTRPCRIAAEIAGLLSLNVKEVRMGLAGMAVVDENVEMLHAAMIDGDTETAIGLLGLGKNVYLGIDALGFKHWTEVHLLGGMCPLLVGTSERERWRWCDTIDRQAVERMSAKTAPPAPTIACFFSAFPDPVVGYTGAEGTRFGQKHEWKVFDEGLTHGDLSIGLDVFERLMRETPTLLKNERPSCF